ncbi:MAG: penicillin-binding protein 2 [bacterium]
MIIIVRLYFLQIVNGQNYSKKADRQYTNISVDTYNRGSIFFQDKNENLISAASLKTGYILALNTKIMATDTENYYKKISEIIPIDAEIFYSKATKINDPYEEIARQISEDKISKISKLKLPGLIIEKENWRYYPGDSLAANLIGFVGFDNAGEKLEGRYGLEKYYDDNLKRDNNGLYTNAFVEIFLNINKNFIQNKEREGDIIITIDPEIQGYVEKIIDDTKKKWDSKTIGAIIINPKNGEIYSMAVSPSFNLNNFKNEKDISIFSNPLVSDSYEMGSIIKALTMTAGIDNGDITAQTTYDDKGFLKSDGYTVYNSDKKSHGIVDMQTILNKSLNTGAAFVMDKIGKNKFLEYMQNYGIGTETGIDLPSEAGGNINNLLDNLNNNKKIEYITASFGQGISMTPIMAVKAFSVLANGGKLIIPHIVKKINYKVGLSKNISYINEAKQIIKKESSEEITRMLVKVVDDALAGGNVKIKNYSIAAKTGTAQIARPTNEGGGYYPDKWLHSFFGYFPAYNPKFLIFLYMIEPKNVNYASQTLTTPFFDISRFLINYYEIAPDR